MGSSQHTDWSGSPALILLGRGHQFNTRYGPSLCLCSRRNSFTAGLGFERPMIGRKGHAVALAHRHERNTEERRGSDPLWYIFRSTTQIRRSCASKRRKVLTRVRMTKFYYSEAMQSRRALHLIFGSASQTCHLKDTASMPEKTPQWISKSQIQSW